jgi:hypothetical protein
MKTVISLIAISAVLLLSSCGVNGSLIVNHNQNTSQVQLSSNNFKVVDRVSGSAEVKYIVCIGGLKKRQLYENAYSEMLKKANLLNGPKAIVNVVTEEHAGGVPPFFIRRTVTVSANVIEFTR